MPAFPPLLALLLAACAGAPADDSGAVDSDGDGVIDPRDCAPEDPAVHPGAAEACDGIDQDCDGAADEGLPRVNWYPDEDADGFGLTGAKATGCAAPEGSTPVGGDCDDTRADVAPGADEWCDGIDHDCDGEAFDADAVDATAWYPDADGDGWGDDGEVIPACLGGAGYADHGGDCDDAAATANPDGREVCDGAGIDEDCDGRVDADDPDAAWADRWYVDADRDLEGGPDPAAVTGCVPPVGYSYVNTDCDDDDASVFSRLWFADGDHDGYSRPEGGVWTCLPILGRSPDARDCDDTDLTIHPGATDACNDRSDDDCNGEDCFLNLFAHGDDAGQMLGISIVGQGDLTGDGVDDLLIGEFAASPPTGAVIFPGPIGPDLSSGARIRGYDEGLHPGVAVRIRDLDGDGQGDALIGADRLAGGTSGGVYLLPGPVLSDTDVEDITNRLVLPDRGTIGAEMDLPGDITGDGLPDLVIGRPADEGAALYAVTAAFGGEVDVASTAGGAIVAVEGVDRLGWTFDAAHDLDGDGVADVAFEAEAGTSVETVRRVFVAYGPLVGVIGADEVDVFIDGTNEEDPYLGDTVQVVPDLDGDGLDDVVAMSAPDVVVLAPASPGSYTLWQKTVARLEDVLGPTSDGSVEGGDFDSDLRGDLAVSCADDDNDRGVLRIFSGPFEGSVPASAARGSWAGLTRGMQLGLTLTNLGDVEGAGRDTLGIMAITAPDEADESGAVYALYGSEIP